jgi:BTB/POZ domain
VQELTFWTLQQQRRHSLASERRRAKRGRGTRKRQKMTDTKENEQGPNTETVRFNVGGVVHEVSRSLLLLHENSMLAKASSKTWQQSSNPEEQASIFICCDGERFRYCLDFMRHGRVFLPPVAVLKAAVLQDLDYYGIEVSDPRLIDSSWASVEAAEHMANKYTQHSETVSGFDEQIKQLQNSFNEQMQRLKREQSSVVLAFECYKLYSVTGVLKCLTFPRDNKQTTRDYDEAPSQQNLVHKAALAVLQDAKFDRVILDKCLAEHGLYYIEHVGTLYTPWVTLGKISIKRKVQS